MALLFRLASIGHSRGLDSAYNPYPPERSLSLGPRLAMVQADWRIYVTGQTAKASCGS